MAQLAICGGSPVRTKPFTAWPIFSQDDEKALIDVLHSERWFMGDRKEAFEKAFAQYQEAEFGVAVSSGTTALQIALEAAGVGLGSANKLNLFLSVCLLMYASRLSGEIEMRCSRCPYVLMRFSTFVVSLSFLLTRLIISF